MKPLTPTYRTFTYKGQEHTLRQWSKILGISYNTLYPRIKNGYTLEQVFGEKEISRGNPNFGKFAYSKNGIDYDCYGRKINHK